MELKVTEDEIRVALRKRGEVNTPSITDAIQELLRVQRERCARVAAEMNAASVAGALGGTH